MPEDQTPVQTERPAGIVEVHPDLVIYEKCDRCHLFIDVNHARIGQSGQPIPGIAEYVHLTSGVDDRDDDLDGSHEAVPSGRLATLLTWKTYGPLAMRERFTT